MKSDVHALATVDRPGSDGDSEVKSPAKEPPTDHTGQTTPHSDDVGRDVECDVVFDARRRHASTSLRDASLTSEVLDDDDDVDDDNDDQDLDSKKRKKTRTVFSRHQVKVSSRHLRVFVDNVCCVVAGTVSNLEHLLCQPRQCMTYLYLRGQGSPMQKLKPFYARQQELL